MNTATPSKTAEGSTEVRIGRRTLRLSRPDKVLAFTSLGALVVALVFVLTPLGSLFGFVALTPAMMLAMAALVAGYLVCAELVKHAAMAHRRRHTGLHHG